MLRWMNKDTFKKLVLSSRAAQLSLDGEETREEAEARRSASKKYGASSSYLVRLAAPRLQAELSALNPQEETTGTFGGPQAPPAIDFDAISFSGFSADDLNLDTTLFQDLSTGVSDVVETLKKQAKPFLAFFQINASFMKNFSIKWPVSARSSMTLSTPLSLLMYEHCESLSRSRW